MNVSTAPGALAPRQPLAHPLLWLLALALAHVVVRVVASSALKWDEAEQLLWSQELALGYGTQPPLYTWLQWLVNQALGPGVLALSVLKHALLSLTYVLMYLAGRELLDERGAWWASATMLLLPPLGWLSVRDHTHTILVTTMACGAWWLLLRICRRPKPLEFALLGLVCGLGMLSKYSFALVAGAMLLAALSVPESRRALLARGWWWAPAVGLLAVLPHATWLVAHLTEATAGTIGKMEIRPDNGLGKGLLSLVGSVAGMMALWTLCALWAFRAAWWRTPRAPAVPWIQRIFVRYLLLIALALLGMVLFAGVSTFRGRWILPLLCMAPLAAFAARPQLQLHPRGGRYTIAIVTVAIAILAAASVRPWLSGLNGQPDELNHPAAELAEMLRAAGYDGTGSIIAADHILAGTLRAHFPHALVRPCTPAQGDIGACVAALVQQARENGHGWLLISRSDNLEPDWWTKAQAVTAPQATRSIDLPFHMMRKGTPPAHYEYIWHPPGSTQQP